MDKVGDFLKVLQVTLPKEMQTDYIKGYLDGALIIIELYIQQIKKSSSIKEED